MAFSGAGRVSPDLGPLMRATPVPAHKGKSGYSCFQLPDVDYMTLESCVLNLLLLVYLAMLL